MPIDVKAAPNLTIIVTVAFVAIISYRDINNHTSYTNILYQRLWIITYNQKIIITKTVTSAVDKRKKGCTECFRMTSRFLAESQIRKMILSSWGERNREAEQVLA